MATAKPTARDKDVPMEDRLPGAMTEGMVKGALVTESDFDHGQVAAMMWGEAIKWLVKTRGGNFTYNQVHGIEPKPEPVRDTSTTSPALVAEMEAEEDDDYDSLMADLDEDIEDVAAYDEALLDLDDADLGPADERDAVPTAEEAGQALFIGMPTTKDYIFDGHWGAGPSGAERWMACTASLGAARAFLETLTPNQQAEFAKASTAARQGTTAHAVAESEARLMLGEISEDEHDNNILDLTITPLDGEEYDDEMAEYVVEYGDFVKQFHQAGHEIIIEMKVTAAIELTTVTNGERDVHEISGSADAVALPIPKTERKKRDGNANVLTVMDLKYGKGKEVEAEENPQTMTYALGVVGELAERGVDIFDIERVDLVIIQPRLGGIKVWSTTVDDLLDWRDEVLSPALTEALAGLKGGAKFVPGEVQCQWCPARGGCAALAEARMDAAVDLFDVIVESEFEGEEFPETTTLSDARLGQLYAQIEGLQKIRDDLKAEVQRRLHRGMAVPGFQLVNYTPRSQWVEGVEEKIEDAVLAQALDESILDTLHTKKLLSPTQALKVLGKGNEGTAKYLEELIDRPDKRPVVAPEGDRRKTWEGKAPEAMFEDES